MITKSLSLDLKNDFIYAVAFNPGFVQTDLIPPGYKGGITPEVSVQSMLNVMENFQPEQNGKMYHFNGDLIPW